MEIITFALLSVATAIHMEQTQHLVDATGHTINLIEAWKDSDKEYNKVIIYLHDKNGVGEDGYELLTAREGQTVMEWDEAALRR